MATLQWGGGTRGALAEWGGGGVWQSWESLVIWWHRQGAEVVEATCTLRCTDVASMRMV